MIELILAIIGALVVLAFVLRILLALVLIGLAVLGMRR